MLINLSALSIGHVYPQETFLLDGESTPCHSVAGRIGSEKILNGTSGIEHATFRIVALPRATHEFVNILFINPSYTTQFAWKYKCIVYHGMLNKYMYWVDHNVDVLPKYSHEFTYCQLKICKKPTWFGSIMLKNYVFLMLISHIKLTIWKWCSCVVMFHLPK